jgi:hypothetical protein
MEQARPTFLTTYLSWIKPSLLALLVGVVTTISTLIGATSSAVPVILKTFNLPDCLTYADVYHGTQSDFRKEGAVWREYPADATAYDYEFREVRRTRDEILLRNLTPREGHPDSASLVVHLPVCGGTAKVTEGSKFSEGAASERSTDFEEVWRATRGS